MNQHIAQNSQGARPFNGHQYPSHFSSRETGYNSGNEPSTHAPGGFRYQEPESTHHYREEVETEIFWKERKTPQPQFFFLEAKSKTVALF